MAVQKPEFLRYLVWIVMSLAALGCQRVEGPQQTEAVTPSLTLDRVIQPYQGPSAAKEFLVLKEYPETVYVTGATMRVLVDPGSRLTPKERLQLVAGVAVSWVNPARHAQLMQQKETPDPNLFCLHQDLPEVRLPAGYGIPMRSNEPLKVNAQWMNRNPYLQPTSPRLQLTLFFQRGAPLRPVRVQALYGWALCQGKSGYFGLAGPAAAELGPECLHSPRVAGSPEVTDSLGQVFQTRWPAPPGTTVNQVLVDSQLRLPEKVVFASASFWPGLEQIRLNRLPDTQLVDLGPRQSCWAPPAPLLLEPGHYQLSLRHRNDRPVTELSAGTMLLYVEDP